MQLQAYEKGEAENRQAISGIPAPKGSSLRERGEMKGRLTGQGKRGLGDMGAIGKQYRAKETPYGQGQPKGSRANYNVKAI